VLVLFSISIAINLVLAFTVLIFWRRQFPLKKAVEYSKYLKEKDISFCRDESTKNTKTKNILLNNLLDFCKDMNIFIEGIYFNLSQNSFTAKSIQDFSTTFSKMAMSQTTSMEELAATITQILSAIESIETSLKSQNGSLTDITVNIGEWNLNLETVYKALGTIKKDTSAFYSTLKDSQTHVQETNNSMKQISETTSKINKITSIIRDISSRTGLLSLNASIEAARAGEAGRGFSVVANEISHLSDSTVNSVKDIEKVIKDAESIILNGEQKVEHTYTLFLEMIGWAGSLNDRLNAIETNLNILTEQSSGIADGIEKAMVHSVEISNASSEHRSALSEISTITELLTEDAANLSMNSHELSALSDELQRITDIYETKLSEFKMT
jgi:aerotaxis receptor